MAKQINNLRKKVMRRVYLAFFMNAVRDPYVSHGALVAFCFVAMTHFVSFTDVFSNLMHVELGRLGSYILASLGKTEIWTVLLLGVIVLAVLSLRFRLPKEERTMQVA